MKLNQNLLSEKLRGIILQILVGFEVTGSDPMGGNQLTSAEEFRSFSEYLEGRGVCSLSTGRGFIFPPRNRLCLLKVFVVFT